MVEHILQAILNGILVGGVYAVVSVGLTLVFGTMDIVNFAQSEFLMLGLFTAYVLTTISGIDPILLIPVVFVVVFIIGASIQRYLIQRVLDAPLVAQIFLTVGIGMVLVSGAQLIFGTDFRTIITSYQMQSLQVGPFILPVTYLFAFAGSSVMVMFLWFFLERTHTGRAIRATAQNSTAAVLIGINPKKMYILAFALGTGLAGAAGALILPYTYVFPTIGHDWGLIMFTVVVLGGLGSVPGALVGGLVVGVLQSLTSVFLPTQLQGLVVFIVFILVLAYRPDGLFGRRIA